MWKRISYRHMQTGDEEAVYDLVRRVFDAFVGNGYSQEGIDEFFRSVSSESLARRLTEDHFILLATHKDRVVGMIDVRDCERISLFFVDADYHRKGIGKTLLNRALANCRNAAPEALHVDVDSSPYAVPIYEKLGFLRTGPLQSYNGIQFVPMVKYYDGQISDG